MSPSAWIAARPLVEDASRVPTADGGELACFVGASTQPREISLDAAEKSGTPRTKAGGEAVVSERQRVDVALARDVLDQGTEDENIMSRIKRLLVPTDFSPTSEIAFNYALDMAAREAASIHLLHVIDDVSLATVYPDGVYVEPPVREEQLIGEAQSHLDTVAAACANAGIPATTQVVVGRASACITAEASTRGSDLIVMGTHGRSGFAHLMLGSVAERVVRAAPCPVLTVRDSTRAGDVIAAEAVSRRQAVCA
jgi:universal stress protein A